MQKDYKKFLLLVSQVDISDKTKCNYTSHVVLMLRSMFITTKYCCKDATADLKGHLVKQFQRLLEFIARQNEFDKFISTLSMFAMVNHLEACKSMLVDAADNIDMNEWMRSIVDQINTMNNNNFKSAEDDKSVMLSLTRCLLVFAELETKSNKKSRNFENTKYFIETCTKLNIFNDKQNQFGPQYLKCFRVLNDFVVGIENDGNDSGDWIKAMSEITDVLQYVVHLYIDQFIAH